MQEFVLFVLGDALSLPPQFQIASAGVFSLFGSLVCRSLSYCVWDDLCGAFTCAVRKLCVSIRLVVPNMEGAKNKSS